MMNDTKCNVYIQLNHQLLGFVLLLLFSAQGFGQQKYSFLVVGDPQYLAEKSEAPSKLDPFSEQASHRSIDILKNFAGKAISEKHGGGAVSDNILGLVNTGDLIDSLDKVSGDYPAMQKFEWARFKADYGLTGKDGEIPFPVYEMHGNHDGPQGDSFLVEEIIERNKTRPGIVNRSNNGLHYSWDWGPLHNITLGMFVGEGEQRRKEHHYAPRASLEFLREDLKTQVGDSGRPVILYFHIHPNTGDYDWPDEDLAAFWDAIEPYNVIAMFHGHTHGSPPNRMTWDGKQFDLQNKLKDGIRIYNPDDVAAAKRDHKDPTKGHGLRHGFLYVELIDAEGEENDRLVVRSYSTDDNWATHDWHTTWEQRVNIPTTKASPAGGDDGREEVPESVRKKFSLDDHYQKHVSVRGLPVVGSSRVSHAAIKEAAWIVNNMIGHRSDILDAMAENGTRLSVMAHNEYTTDVPEHSHLADRAVYWNRRARGLGASPTAPAVSCGEENLLCYPNDPYSEENICIHEFAHAIHLMGISTLDPSFDARLEAAFKSATEKKLWKDTYAATNHYEYWGPC